MTDKNPSLSRLAANHLLSFVLGAQIGAGHFLAALIIVLSIGVYIAICHHVENSNQKGN